MFKILCAKYGKQVMLLVEMLFSVWFTLQVKKMNTISHAITHTHSLPQRYELLYLYKGACAGES